MRDDMAIKGWLPTHLAKRAKLSDQSVSRFFRGEAQSAPTAKRLARALGYSVRRYLISARSPVPLTEEQRHDSPKPVKRSTPRRSQASDESVVGTSSGR
jgi:transcriptional regulator with XRE-family HTH domain